MRIPEARLPDVKESWRYVTDLVFQIRILFNTVGSQLNNLTEGRISAVTNAATAAPTTGDHKQGDYIRHSAPVEAGAPGAKYVIIGFVCIADGNPGTWREVRTLTGN